MKTQALRNNRGMTLVEILIAIGISLIFVTASQTFLVHFLRARTTLARSVMTKVLTSQIVSDVSSNWKKYPLIYQNGSYAGYVLCYDQSLGLVPYSTTNTVLVAPLTTIMTSGTPQAYIPQCQTAYEVRITPTYDGSKLVWMIRTGTRNVIDPSSLEIKAQADLTNATSF